MKKNILGLVLLLTLSFSGCTGVRKNRSGNIGDTPIMTKENTNPDISIDKNWDLNILPDGFVNKPSGIIAESLNVYEEYEDLYTGYSGTLYKLNFRTNEKQLDVFNNTMHQNGWIGSIEYSNTGNGYVKGKWANDSYYVSITRGYAEELETDNLTYTIKMEIYRMGEVFPKSLTNYYPILNKFTVVTNDYVGFDISDNKYSYEFSGSLDDYWCWYFTGNGAFCGVTKEDFEKYISLLEKNGFSVYRYPEGEKNHIKVDAQKKLNDKNTAYVSLDLNTALCTLEATYSNNIEYFNK